MTQSATRLAISSVAKQAHVELLVAEGFRRAGNHMYRPSADVFHGVHFQASQWGSADEGKFTINLGVASAEIYEFWTGKPLPKNPATALFPLQSRIGLLMPDRKDHWWDVTRSTDLSDLAVKVIEALRDFALPFFAAYPDTAALLAKLRETGALPGLTQAQGPVIHAITAHCRGLREEAEAQLQEALNRASRSTFAGTVRTIGGRLGIL